MTKNALGSKTGSNIVKAEKHEKKTLLDCCRCGRNLYPENIWYMVWTEERNAIAEGICKKCLTEEFLR